MDVNWPLLRLIKLVSILTNEIHSIIKILPINRLQRTQSNESFRRLERVIEIILSVTESLKDRCETVGVIIPGRVPRNIVIHKEIKLRGL